MTDSFGARLRRERERRNIDVADVAARTKVKACLFEALERDDVSQWPAGLFRRSFIRGYAEAVGLDPKATLREFLEHFPDPADPPADAPQPAAVPAAVALKTAASGEPTSNMRLTLADGDTVFQSGSVLVDSRGRWLAAALDMAVVIVVALVLFVIVNRFWMPLGIAALSYYAGGILLLGNSPGVWLFAPEDAAARASASGPNRAPRPRHTDAGRGRPAEPARNPFRAPRRARNARG
jgi:transcriptional regulator with XRE-family HTH domain